MTNISIIRNEKGIKQKQLADILGLKCNTLSQYETGKRNPNIAMLKKIASVLGCSVDDLIKDSA